MFTDGQMPPQPFPTPQGICDKCRMRIQSVEGVEPDDEERQEAAQAQAPQNSPPLLWIESD